MWYTYIMEFYSAIKRKEIMPFAEIQTELETITQNEVSQKEKNRYCILMDTYGIQKNGTDKPICKAETETQTQRKNKPILRGKGGGMDWEIGIGIHMVSSVSQSCLTLCDPMDCSTPGFPVHHQLPELAQTHVH